MTKKTCLQLFLFLGVLCGCSKPSDVIMEQARELIVEKKYESAFKLLVQADSTYDNPDYVLLEEHIVMNYYVWSIMHRMFALMDIGRDEDILDYRGKEGEMSISANLPFDSLLTRLIVKYPEKCELYKGLADYYYWAYDTYGGDWLIAEEELLRLIEDNYQAVIERHCADFDTYFRLGVVYVGSNNAEKSIALFKSAVQMDDQSAAAYYNLAYAYYMMGKNAEAIPHCKKAFALYSDSVMKGDAARMLGWLYANEKDVTTSIVFFEKADSLTPKNYYNLKPLLGLYLQNGDERVSMMTQQFYDLVPEKPTIYNDLAELYSDYGKQSDLISFYKRQLTKFTFDPTSPQQHNQIVGNLYFYLASLYLDSDKDAARTCFFKSKAIFKDVYEADHPVFETIEKGLQKCQ